MRSSTPIDRTTIQSVARAVRRHGLRLPALLVLEAGAPLAPVAGQLLYVAQPLLSLVTGRSAIGDLARLLEDRNAVAALVDELEQV